MAGETTDISLLAQALSDAEKATAARANLLLTADRVVKLYYSDESPHMMRKAINDLADAINTLTRGA